MLKMKELRASVSRIETWIERLICGEHLESWKGVLNAWESKSSALVFIERFTSLIDCNSCQIQSLHIDEDLE
jgi:hypothetical protein